MKIKFTIGAIKAIKNEIGLDLMKPDDNKNADDLIASNLEALARIAIKHEKPGVTDKEAETQAQFATVGDIVQGIEESFGKRG